MKTAEASIYLDELRPKKNGKCSVKIKITFNRKRKYFSTGIDLTPEEFQKVMQNKRRNEDQKEIHLKLNYFYTKAVNTLKNLNVFTFDAFEERFFEQRNTQNSVSFSFEKYIDQLKAEKRLGTAVSYECAKNSIVSFKKDLTFAEVTPSFLKKYENWMLESNKSVSTIGIYLRSLRAIYNIQNIDKSIYPFGEGKNKYSIPTGRNIKKALTVEEIAKIYNYEAKPGTTKEMAKDYWLFLYLCNGMNVKDFCLLKWENIDDNMLTYKRAKTLRSKKQSKSISVALKPETLEIIKKWAIPSLSKEGYIFPHLQPGMDSEKERKTYQQLTKTINKYIKQIVSELEINKNVTTYYARHSFATVLKRSGAKIEMISELLGHSSVDVTESYLDSFEKEQIQKETDVLTFGFRKAN
ncbi:site-specific integrase [Cyclobacterium marinum]|uniref:site-specific integrase n=1 Tax=Cyclobacterium marinum TaxID=104 RepID=UPI0011EC8869|nr:site-specific integrase [Cyclobacterium marinum]MBI0401364.1 site-specific integrase [Cyclobacterium marinum]